MEVKKSWLYVLVAVLLVVVAGLSYWVYFLRGHVVNVNVSAPRRHYL